MLSFCLQKKPNQSKHLLAFLITCFGIHGFQIYRVSDMELVRALPSSDDEVNVTCFHPLAGGGLVYGTKVRFKILLSMVTSLYSQD